MTQYRPVFSNIPPVVKNLIIINVLIWLATFVLGKEGIDVYRYLALFFPASKQFGLHQVFTHMFMHGGWMHIFFNMFALWMFGRILENVWGPKRFLFYYLVTGVGAALFYTLVHYIEFESLIAHVPADQLNYIKESGYSILHSNQNFSDPTLAKLNELVNTPTVGASGAIFGVLLAFGMLFPNTQLMLIIPPIPIKAKYFVIGYGVLELYLGITQSGSHIAHFAHLGGMLFGFILIKYWNKSTKKFY